MFSFLVALRLCRLESEASCHGEEVKASGMRCQKAILRRVLEDGNGSDLRLET